MFGPSGRENDARVVGMEPIPLASPDRVLQMGYPDLTTFLVRGPDGTLVPGKAGPMIETCPTGAVQPIEDLTDGVPDELFGGRPRTPGRPPAQPLRVERGDATLLDPGRSRARRRQSRRISLSTGGRRCGDRALDPQHVELGGPGVGTALRLDCVRSLVGSVGRARLLLELPRQLVLPLDLPSQRCRLHWQGRGDGRGRGGAGLSGPVAGPARGAGRRAGRRLWKNAGKALPGHGGRGGTTPIFAA